jgi:hypothetical protein
MIESDIMYLAFPLMQDFPHRSTLLVAIEEYMRDKITDCGQTYFQNTGIQFNEDRLGNM